ncbi:cry [Symbiodinium sp. CCMP2592]|nr:cry [Symbiodinium sp. CCMP2592]
MVVKKLAPKNSHLEFPQAASSRRQRCHAPLPRSAGLYPHLPCPSFAPALPGLAGPAMPLLAPYSPTLCQVDIPRVARLVRPCLPDLELGSLPLPEAQDLGFEPTWRDLPYAEELPEPYRDDEFLGGEEAGLERLSEYVRTDFQYTFHTDRLEHFGEYYASRLGPWMAHGCLSPRKVFEEICRCEVHSPGLAHTQRLVVELTWRDFFRYLSGKHGNGIFREGGVKGYKRKWKQDVRMFNLWSEGRTGYPLVDACMRELEATGLASNHARLNAASFLACSMGFDWRRGADWFESHLLDYDVTSNWANWVRCAGLTEGRLSSFNVVRQSQKLDPDGVYLKRWLPELEQVAAPLIHEPWLMTSEEASVSGACAYPPPCIDPSFFEGWMQILDQKRSKSTSPFGNSKKGLAASETSIALKLDIAALLSVWRLESENKELKVHNSILQTQYTSQYETNADILRTLHSNLEGNYATIERHERTIMELEHKLEDQKQQAKDDLDTEMAKPMKDAVIAKLKTQKEELEGQLKEVREFQRDKENMEKELASLKQQLEDNKEDFARKMSDYDRKKAVDMDILRQDMVQKVQDANEMLKAKTKEQLDSTTKRTIMENEQMFTELHFQSKETEKLMERNQSLLEENAQLRRNLLIHKDLENELARRTHLYQRLLKKMDQKLKSEAAQQEQSREFNPAKSTESAIPEQESFSLGGSREVSGSHPHSTSLSVEEISRLQRQVEDHQSTLQMVRHEFAQYRRDHATLAQLQDQSTRLIISALYELKQQKDQAPFPPTSYDPDAEWQFTNMTPKQKEYFFRVLLEKLNSSMCAMCFPVGPQATSTASLPAIGKTEQGGKEGMRFSQFLWSVATDDGPSQGSGERARKLLPTAMPHFTPNLRSGYVRDRSSQETGKLH